MAVPQNRVTRSRRNQRRSHDALTAGNPNECPSCGELKRPHHVCPSCGSYNANECPSCGELKRPHHVCPSCGSYNDREVIAQADEIDLDDDAA